VREAMTFRLGENLPIAPDTHTVKQVLHDVSAIKRRSGAVILVDDAGKVSGIFTDGDLRRCLGRGGAAMSDAVASVMTRMPRTIGADRLAADCVVLMETAPKVTQLVVVDASGILAGAVHMHDLFRARVV
jgi:arabinose-5-phosphate isomerase